MTLEQLSFVCAVKAAGTIINAAQSCNVSHTTVSRAISTLEDELGFVIFDRSRRGCVLTTKGEEVARLAESILRDSAAIARIGHPSGEDALHIGSYPIVTTDFLQVVVSGFNQLHPNTTLFIDHAKVNEVTAAVKAHQLDFGLIFTLPELLPNIEGSVQVTELLESNLVAVCSPKSQLAAKKYATLEDLKKETFILQSEEQVSYMMKYVFFPDCTPRIPVRSNDNDLIKSTIASSSMVGTYIEMFIANDPMVKSGQLVYVPIKVGQKLYKLKYLYIRPLKKPLSTTERAFIRILKKTARAYSDRGGDSVLG